MRWVFAMSGAYLGRIDGATRCAFWSDDPMEHGFDPAKLIEIDLARTPGAAMAGKIPPDAVDVDDCFTAPGGDLAGTTLGPRWPEMQLAGTVLLEQHFLARLPPEKRPLAIPDGGLGRAYEYQTAIYWPRSGDPRAGCRYAGHHAEILEERGGLIRVKVFPPGTSTNPDARSSTMWIDPSSPEQCDAGPHAMTTIGPGAAPKQGALFLIAGRMDDDDA